jgi:hypothetical protein
MQQKQYPGLVYPHYQDFVARGYELGSTYIFKFGRNDAVSTTLEDIWDGGSTYDGWLDTGSTITVLADNAADVAAGTGVQSVRILGLDSDYAPISEDVTMNADTTAGSSSLTAFYRVNRVYGLSAGTGEINAGDIVLTASTGGNEVARMTAGSGQTLMSLWTVPAGYDMIIEDMELTAAATDEVEARFEYQISSDNVWRCQWTGEVHGQVTVPHLIGGIMPAQTDIRIRALSDLTGGATGKVSASFLGIMYPTGL